MLSGDLIETEALTMRCPTCGAGPQVLCDRVEVGGVRPLSHLERRRIAGQGGPLHNFEMLSGDSIETEALTMRCPTCGAGPQVLCDRVEVGGVRRYLTWSVGESPDKVAHCTILKCYPATQLKLKP